MPRTRSPSPSPTPTSAPAPRAWAWTHAWPGAADDRTPEGNAGAQVAAVAGGGRGRGRLRTGSAHEHLLRAARAREGGRPVHALRAEGRLGVAVRLRQRGRAAPVPRRAAGGRELRQDRAGDPLRRQRGGAGATARGWR